MSVATEISRIQTARNKLRTKAVDLGIGTSTDNLTQLANEYDGIVNRGSVSAQVQEGHTCKIIGIHRFLMRLYPTTLQTTRRICVYIEPLAMQLIMLQ